MEPPKKILEFVVFCIEMYARDYDMSGTEVCKLFEKYGLLDYLFDNYEPFHTQGWEYIKATIEDLR